MALSLSWVSGSRLVKRSEGEDAPARWATATLAPIRRRVTSANGIVHRGRASDTDSTYRSTGGRAWTRFGHRLDVQEERPARDGQGATEFTTERTWADDI